MRRVCNHLYANSRHIGNARVQRYGLSIATEPPGNKNALFSAKQILSSTKGRAGAFAFITVPSLIIASNMNGYSKMEAAAEGVVLLQDLKNVKDAEEKKKSNKKEVSSAMLLIQSMKPEWWLYLIAGLSSTLLSLLGSFQAKAFGALLGALRDGNTSIFNPVKNIVIIFLGQAGLGFISSYSLAIAVTNLGTRLRQNLFDSILSQDIELFDRKSSGELSNMLGNDIASMQTSIRTSFTSGIEGVASLISGGIHLFATSPTLAGVMLTLLPLGTLSANLLGFILSSLSEKTRKANAQASGIASECISSIRTVRAFNSEEHESKRYEDSLEEVASLKVKMAALTGAFFASIRLGINLSSVLVCAIGKILMDRGDLQFSDIAALLAQVQLIERALAQLSVVSAQVSKSLTSSEHIFKLIQQRPTVNVSRSIYQEKLDVSKIQGRVEFNNISFVYPTRPDAMVIEGLSLVIEPGQYVSIVGGSGSGKTTTVSLLERFYDISKGQILIDGIDIRDMRPQDLHSIIAIVSQQPDLFSCSIADNIRYGKPNATMEEVREAARKANALEFIESFPKGFDTMCGERGVSLSGGQRQRIAIARAILRQPKILILDECTSALDSESEHSIQVALRELMQGRTTIAISHRLATVVNSDSIVVLEEGKIVEKGKHADLMKNDAGSYKNLFKRQNTRSLPRKE